MIPFPWLNVLLSLLTALDLVPMGSTPFPIPRSRLGLAARLLVPIGSIPFPLSRLAARLPARLVLESRPGASFLYRAPAPTARAEAEMSGCGTSLLVEVGESRREGER